MGQCLLIDGNNIVFRAFYAMEGKGFRSRSGQPTGALFGFGRMLVKLLRERKPDLVAVAFDVSRDTFRRKLYPEYKAHRRPTPPELLTQLPLAHELVKALGIRLLTHQDVEADDLIGAVAESFKSLHPVRIITGDRDLLQLIDDAVLVELCVKGISDMRVVGRAEFEQEYGFPPLGIIDLKALQGDASDNIPGVDGIGEKKGLALVREFGSVDRLFASLETVANPKLRAQLEAGRASAFLSRDLATIRREVDGLPTPEECAWHEDHFRRPEFLRLLQEFNFTSMIREMGLEGEPLSVAGAPPSPAPAIGAGATPLAGAGSVPFSHPFSALPGSGAGAAPAAESGPGDGVAPAALPLAHLEGERSLCSTREGLSAFLAGLGSEVCLDIETDGFDPFRDRLVGFSLAGGPDRAIYVPLRHIGLEIGPGDQVEPREAIAELQRGLPGKTLVGHNLKFDLEFLAREGFRHAGPFYDTMLAAYVVDPTRQNGLKPLARDLLQVEVTEFQQVAKNRSFAEVPLADAAFYGGQDALLPLRLKPILEQDLRAAGLHDLFAQLEMPVLGLLLDMETVGIGLNKAYLADLSRDLNERLQTLEITIHEQAGVSFNVNSNKQLQEILFTKLGLTPPKKTKTGFSTDGEVLKQLVAAHPICVSLLEYRELAKLKTTYADTLASLIDPRTGLIHTSFNQTVTATGRLSSSNPNLQNIPIKTEWGRKVRRAFLPPRTGDVFLSFDYSQIELRLLAHFAGDPALVEAFHQGLDIHSMTASRLFGKPPEEVSSSERKVGKTVNFGIVYGISAHGLAEDLGIPRPVAKEYIDAFFAGFPGVNAWFERNLEEARKTGFVATLFGRRRPVPDLGAKNFSLRSFAERVARNTPLQGSAADLVKKAMLVADDLLRQGGYQTRLMLQVHDELVFTVPPAEVSLVGPLLKRCMEQVVTLNVPLVCDAALGPNLADLEDQDF